MKLNECSDLLIPQTISQYTWWLVDESVESSDEKMNCGSFYQWIKGSIIWLIVSCADESNNQGVNQMIKNSKDGSMDAWMHWLIGMQITHITYGCLTKNMPASTTVVYFHRWRIVPWPSGSLMTHVYQYTCAALRPTWIWKVILQYSSAPNPTTQIIRLY